MATYYCGPGGSDANSGATWALRKLTLTGAEDKPVAGGDTVIVGPGTYRELLTLDVSGTAGNIITYIADVTGQNTDGVGGLVRITGSDNDTTATRANCITTGRNYRTFRGFSFDNTTSTMVSLSSGPTNVIIEDCFFNTQLAAANGISLSGTIANITVRRCVFYGMKSGSINFTHTSTVDNTACLIENCIFWATNGRCVSDDRIGGITIKNCLMMGGTSNGVRVATALTAGQTVTVNNCIFVGLLTALQATATGEIVENYNTFFTNGTDRTLTNTGANSDVYPHPLYFGILLAGLNLGNLAFYPESWAATRAIAGTSEATDDFFGMTRPTTSAKISRGPVQFNSSLRDVATVRTGAASIKLPDAGRHQMFVPVTNVSTTISCYVRREANYTGTAPQMIIKQPGVADRTTTDAGAVSTWNQLTDTFTPAALPPYVVVELVSGNTATSSSFATYFDDLVVS